MSVKVPIESRPACPHGSTKWVIESFVIDQLKASKHPMTAPQLYEQYQLTGEYSINRQTFQVTLSKRIAQDPDSPVQPVAGGNGYWLSASKKHHDSAVGVKDERFEQDGGSKDSSATLEEEKGQTKREQREYFADWLRQQKCLVPRWVPMNQKTQQWAGYTFGMKLTEYLGQTSVEIWAIVEFIAIEEFDDQFFEDIARNRLANKTYVAPGGLRHDDIRLRTICERFGLGIVSLDMNMSKRRDAQSNQDMGGLSHHDFISPVEAPFVALPLSRIRETGTELIGIHSLADLSAFYP